jgi:hypothetical protein
VSTNQVLDIDARRHFRDELRRARADVLLNSEDHYSVVQALEGLGRFMVGYGAGLGKFQSALEAIAKGSALCDEIPSRWHGHHLPFARLMNSIREARNVAIHEGAVARRLAVHSIECALILEDALQADMTTVSEFMVRSPVIAELWHPLSFVRQTMLTESYSFLPIKMQGVWHFLSDASVAAALRGPGTRKERDRRLSLTLQQALAESLLLIHPAPCAGPSDGVSALAASAMPLPVLVLAPPTNDLVGILTAFDLL